MRARPRIVAASVVLVLSSFLLVTPASGDSPGRPPAVVPNPTAIPSGLLVDETNGRVWVTDAGSEAITVTDLEGGAPQAVPVGQGASSPVLSPDGQFVHVARGRFVSGPEAEVVTFRARDLTEVSRTSVGAERCPVDLAYAGGRLWVAYGCSNARGDVAPIDPFVASSPLPAAGRYDALPSLASAGGQASELVVVGSVNRTAYAEVLDAASGASLRRSLDLPGAGAVSVHGGQGLVAVATPAGARVLDLGDLGERHAFPGQTSDVAFDPAGRHVLLADRTDGFASYALQDDLVAHGRRAGVDLLAWAGSGRIYAAQYGALLLQDGWDVDPLDLSLDADVTQVEPGSAVLLRGRLATTDGRARPSAPLTLTRSGPGGTVPLAPVRPEADGTFVVQDTVAAPGGVTYRVSHARNDVHPRATAQVSVQVGDPGPARVVRPAERGAVTTLPLDQPAVKDVVVDDLHGRVFVSGGESSDAVSVLDLDGVETDRLPLPGAAELRMSPDQTTLLVSLVSEPTVVVVDAATLAEVDRWWLGPKATGAHSAALVGDQLLWSSQDAGYAPPDGYGVLDPSRTRRVTELLESYAPRILPRPEEPDRAVLVTNGDLGDLRVEDGRVVDEHRLIPPGGGERAYSDLAANDDLIDLGNTSPEVNGGLASAVGDRLLPYGRTGTSTARREVDPRPETPDVQREASAVAVTADARFAAVAWSDDVLRLVPFETPGEALWEEEGVASDRGSDPAQTNEGSHMAFSPDASHLVLAAQERPGFGPRPTTVTVVRDPLGGIGEQLPLPPRDLHVTQGQTTSRVSWKPSPDDGGRPITGYRVETDKDGPAVTLGPDARGVLLNGTEPETTVTVRALTSLGASRPRTASPPAPLAGPSSGRAVDDACPREDVPGGAFGDVPAGDPHTRGIECVAWWGVTTGRGPGVFAPGAEVSRDAMASFLARAITFSGGQLPETPPDAFDDDNGSVHERAINQLAAVGVVKGVGERAFGPIRLVTRGQMARFLAGAYAHRAGAELPAGSDAFADDDDSLFEADIDRVAAAGIAGGRAPGAYSPGTTVTRAQLATFLSRWLDAMVEQGAPGVRTP